MIEHVQLNSETSGLSITAILHQKTKQYKKTTWVCMKGKMSRRAENMKS